MIHVFVYGLVMMCSAVSAVDAQTCPGITYKVNKLPPEKKCVSPCGIRTLYLPRSQGNNMARWLAGWKEYAPGCDKRAWGNISLAPAYSRSFDGDRIAQYLFGSTQLKFSGSQVINRAPDELLADNFGLPTTFRGAIAFKPSIDNIILDFNYDLGLDTWFYGLFCRINAQVVTTRWDLGIRCNEVNNISSQEAPVFPACYMAKTAVPTALSIKEALSGSFIFGDMEQPLMFGAFPCGRERRTHVASIELVFGWDFLRNERSHAGFYLSTIIPTGNKPKSKVIFEPIVGNGNLWELGPGITFHYDFVRQGNHILALYAEAVLAHQFRRFQIRSYDLRDHGPFSRYMLLKEFNANGVYDNSLINAIDFCTRATRVGGSARFDGAVKLSYYYDRWGLDVGYNLYAKSKERLRVRGDLYPSEYNNRRLGIKGTQGVCYRILPQSPQNPPGPLNSTENQSTAYHSGPIDNPTAIVLPPGEIPITWDSPTTGNLIIAQNSKPPVIIDEVVIRDGRATDRNLNEVLDLRSGSLPHQLTHKFFFNIGYTALDTCWEPQWGIGFEYEVDGRKELLNGLNQWGIWFKGSFSY